MMFTVLYVRRKFTRVHAHKIIRTCKAHSTMKTKIHFLDKKNV